MNSSIRSLSACAAVGVLTVAGVLGAAARADAATPRVVIYDNDAPPPSQGIDPWTGRWGFEPRHVTVVKGEPVVFDHPAGNFRPHTVVSITNAGSPAEPRLESGARFNSGTAMEAWLRPGGSWTLDTNAVDPGHYGYYCSLHPWMVGSVTVLQP